MAHLPSIQIGPFTRAQGSIVLPGSKSISNRVLLLAALSSGTTTLKNLLDADDTQVMRNALRQLGLSVTDKENNVCVVQGCSGKFPVRDADLFMGNAGTAIRPLTAALAMQGGNYRLSGVARMHESAPLQGQVRCVAVATGQQGKGIGKLIMSYLEKVAVVNGWQEVVLEARENAVPFYESLGYSIVEKSYLLFGEIQHYRMKKALLSSE